MIAGKVWGTTQLLLATPMLEVHRLVVLSGSYCSLHKHEGRWNAFLVTKGRLYIEVHQKDYPLVDTTVAEPGDVTTVPPGLLHLFRTDGEGAECFELYYPPSLGSEDIVRQAVGGSEDEVIREHISFDIHAVDPDEIADKILQRLKDRREGVPD